MLSRAIRGIIALATDLICIGNHMLLSAIRE